MNKLHIEGASSEQAGTSTTNFKRKPVIIIVVGMAGNVAVALFESCFFIFCSCPGFQKLFHCVTSWEIIIGFRYD